MTAQVRAVGREETIEFGPRVSRTPVSVLYLCSYIVNKRGVNKYCLTEYKLDVGGMCGRGPVLQLVERVAEGAGLDIS